MRFKNRCNSGARSYEKETERMGMYPLREGKMKKMPSRDGKREGLPPRRFCDDGEPGGGERIEGKKKRGRGRGGVSSREGGGHGGRARNLRALESGLKLWGYFLLENKKKRKKHNKSSQKRPRNWFEGQTLKKKKSARTHLSARKASNAGSVKKLGYRSVLQGRRLQREGRTQRIGSHKKP